MIVPGERFFAPFKSCPGFVGGGGGGMDEIDTCITHWHFHVKSDMARPKSVDQVIHASLKCI